MTTTRFLKLLGIVAAILLIPLIVMQFTAEMNWDLTDFLIMGSVLLSIGLTYELIAARSEKFLYRAALGIGMLAIFLLFWVNGAVGIIGSENQDVNYLYGAVFVVCVIGSIMAKFKSKGMSRALFVTALAQMIVPVVALFIWPPPTTSWSPSIFGVFWLNTFFALLFIISGILFKRASNQNSVNHSY